MPCMPTAAALWRALKNKLYPVTDLSRVGDGITLWLLHPKLPHHSTVFMLQVMAVK
jgi:hypothetical protein